RLVVLLSFFFFSSRRRHTRFSRDWSSDVCSSDLTPEGKVDFDKDFFGKEAFLTVYGQLNGETYACALSKIYTFGPTFRAENSNRSEERRVGKECRFRWSRDQ